MFLGPKAKTWELGLGKVGQILTVDLKKAGETQLTVDSAGFDRSCCAAAKRAPNPLLLSMVAESDVPARHRLPPAEHAELHWHCKFRQMTANFSESV